MFSWGELGRTRRQRQQRDVARGLESLRLVPSGLIKNDDSVRARGDFRGDLVEMKLHGLGIAGRQDQGGAGATRGADSTEHIGRLSALIMDRSRT